jgi:ATP-dependent exoDNAse (exonuclease V) beta subunit
MASQTGSTTGDMIAETADGFLVIDHKSDIVENRQERFIHYLPQLECYASAVTAAHPEKPVKGIVINWVSYGEVYLMDL